MSVGDFLLKRLAELGARYVFGVPGDYNLWFLEQAERSNHVEFVGCCNELNAAYAADGFARLRGSSVPPVPKTKDCSRLERRTSIGHPTRLGA